MSLRLKILSITGAMILILIACVDLISRNMVTDVFSRLEERLVRHDVRHALNALADETSTLQKTAGDYAMRDGMIPMHIWRMATRPTSRTTWEMTRSQTWEWMFWC
jgi:sensor domain CHASE-containing protein